MPKNEELEKIRYKRNYLTEVIARVDLAAPITELEKKLPDNIKNSVREYFPKFEPQTAFSHTVKLELKEVKTEKVEFTQWNFYGKEREKKLTIQPSAILVVYNDYKTYEQLRGEFTSIINDVCREFDQAQPGRLGLRYINQIEFNNSIRVKWEEYINSELMGLLAYRIGNAEPSRIFHNYEAVFEELNLRFQFGLHNPDYPAPIKRNVFVLDIDAYHSGLIDFSEIPKRLDEHHLEIQKIFERSITENLRSKMNEDR